MQADKTATAVRTLPAWVGEGADACQVHIEKLIGLSPFHEHIRSATFLGRKLRAALALRALSWRGLPREGAEYDFLLRGLARVELLHSASCIFDDIIDGDRTRRGVPAFYVREGLPLAILCGLEMTTLASHAPPGADEREREACRRVERTIRETLLGEACDALPLARSQPLTKSLGDLATAYAAKTYPSFALAFWLVGRSYRMGAELETKLEEFGGSLGVFYQHANDHYDLLDIEQTIRGDANDEVLVAFSIPLLKAIENEVVSRDVIGTRMPRWKVSKLVEDIKASDVPRRSAEATRKAKERVLGAYPFGEPPADLRAILEAVDSRYFWSYSYEAAYSAAMGRR